MNLKTAFFIINFLFILSTSFSQIPAGYYSNTVGLTGDSLKDRLNDIIDNHIEFPYTSSSQMDCWDVLKQADKDPNNASNVVGIYSRFSMNGPAEYNSGQGWSREHVWAKSRGNFGTARGEGTDLHNLFAADISTNSARNNRNFDIGISRYIDNGGTYNGSTDAFTSSSTWVWEPPDSLKGDVARVIFYMDVRYEGEHGELDLEVIDSLLSNTDQSPLHGNARILYNWHLIDTVNSAERARNDTIYKYQNNRNPFVDHPEFVREIYASKYGPISVGINEIHVDDIYKIYPNPSDEYIKIEAKEGQINEVIIYDGNGSIVSRENFNSSKVRLSTSSLNRGIYFIQITNSKGLRRTHPQLVK